MKYYQLFYNASESSLSGGQGFGIRTTTENMPKEYLDAVLADESLQSYQGGNYSISEEDILKKPELIREAPISYYYKKLPLSSGGEVYAVGRIVNACFDFPFYHTGKMTRSGNLVNHIYLFEQKPDPSVFDLLFEQPQPGANRFLPKDWSPRLDNPEMTGLMLGKPELLPVEEKPFASTRTEICEKAFTLFFQFLALRAEGKPIVVRTKAEEANDILAGFMRLLPAQMAGDVTFSTNHQRNGLSKGIQITFINEYYPYTVYTASCQYLDFIEGNLTPTALEDIYRKELETAVSSGNATLRQSLSEWICSEIAARNVSKPRELNQSLFRYAHQPEKFSLSDLGNTPGLLEELAVFIGGNAEKAALLNSLLSKCFQEASGVTDFKKIIQLAEQCKNARIPVNDAMQTSRQVMTGKALGSIGTLHDFFFTLGENTFNQYADKTQMPALRQVLEEIVPAKYPFEEKQALVRYLEPDAAKRAGCYRAEILAHPEEAGLYENFLAWDSAETDKIDWLEDLKGSLQETAVANLLFEQLQRHPKSHDEQLDLYAGLSAKNEGFKRLVEKNAAQIYSSACDRFERQTRPEDYEKTWNVIAEKVLPFIQGDSDLLARYNRLSHVMKGEVPEKMRPEEYWDLSGKMGNQDYQKKLIPRCLEAFKDPGKIKAFVKDLLAGRLLTEKELVARVVESKVELPSRIAYWKALKTAGRHDDYESIFLLGKDLQIPEQQMDNVFENEFKSELTAYKHKKSREKFRKLMGKKSIWISCILILVLAMIALGLIFWGDKILKPGSRNPDQTVDPSQTAIPDSSQTEAKALLNLPDTATHQTTSAKDAVKPTQAAEKQSK